MPGCFVPNCKCSYGKGFRMHALPSDINRRCEWINSIVNSNQNVVDYPATIPPTSNKICTVHFRDDQYVDNDRTARLKQDAVPSVFLDRNGLVVDLLAQNQDQNAAVDPDPDPEQLIDQDQSGTDSEADPEPEPVRPVIDQDRSEDEQEAEQDAENEQMEVDDEVFERYENIDFDVAPREVLIHNLQAAAAENVQLRNEREQLRAENHRLTTELRQAEDDFQNFRQNVRKFLNEDQINFFQRAEGKRNTDCWTVETIKSALQIRLMTGVNAYEFLRNEKGWPLPSYRTLCRRLQKCTFAPGTDNDIIPYLGLKIRGENDAAKDAELGFDEMEMSGRVEYDLGLKKYIGYVSPELLKENESPKTPAKKVLVLVAKGLTLKWKQIVAYFFVHDSVDQEKLWHCILDVINRLQAEGLRVRGVVSDMGPNNTGMWGAIGILSHRRVLNNFIEHPFPDPEHRLLLLYFSADLVHLLKNLWCMLLNQKFYLPATIVQEHPEWQGNNVVSVEYVGKLFSLQQKLGNDRGLVMAFKLKKYHLDPSSLQRMNAKLAAQFFSHTVSSAIETCIHHPEIPQMDHTALPTAWFLKQTNQWFDIMNERRDGLGENPRSENKIQVLKQYIELIQEMAFEKKGWKPVQTGIIISTKTVIDLYEDLVVAGPLHYLLPGRLTTDCVENAFAQLRGYGNSHPGPVATRTNLRLISVSQFMFVPRSSNYEAGDDTEYLADFLKPHSEIQRELQEIPEEYYAATGQLSVIEEMAVYQIAGWAAKMASGKCLGCQEKLIGERLLVDAPHEWTFGVNRGGLTHPTEAAYGAVRFGEEIFQSIKDSILTKCDNVRDQVVNEIVTQIDDEIAESLENQCHNTLERLIQRFVNMRVHVHAGDQSRTFRKTVSHAGRTAYGKTVADNYGGRSRTD